MEIINSWWEENLLIACQSYFDIVMEMQDLDGITAYGKDKLRTMVHDEILEITHLSREELYPITNHLRKFQDGADLYIEIKHFVEEKRRATNDARRAGEKRGTLVNQ